MSLPTSFTLGVEEEYQVIDPQTRNLCPLAEPIMLEASKELGQQVQPEIHLTQLEIATPVCQTLAEVRRELERSRREMIRAAARFDKVVAAAGSHPFSHWKEQPITPKDRYLALERDYKQLAREQSIFGCHVHVGVSDRESAVQVVNHARIWLSPLLALTGNSPFWWGTETGYASYRAGAVWARWPQAGPPQIFSSLAEYEALTRALLMTKCIEDLTKIYWDMRLSERFPTVEVRVMDVCMTVDEAVMVAGLVRALVRTCYEQAMSGVPVPEVRQELLRVAHWRAARDGLDGDLIDVRSPCALPARQMIKRFLDFLRPALEAHGDWDEVCELVRKTIQQGIGAARQREVYRNTGSLEEVVDFVIAQTTQGLT